MGARLTTEKFIERAIAVHGYRYDYSKVVYTNSQAKVIIICKEHGEFEQRAGNHLSGCNCKTCGHIENELSRKISISDFIIRANVKHGGKFDYSMVKFETTNECIDIICSIHGIFKQRASNHLCGGGCNQCRTHTQDEFIEKSIEIHGNRYDYSKVDYINTTCKVIIICKEHGEFLQTPNRHLIGNNCPICANVSHVGRYEEKTRNTWENKDGYFYNVILEHKDSKERFGKVGISINPTVRFNQYLPYRVVDIIELSKMKLGKAFDIEVKMLKNINKYKPLEKFGGYTECYI